LSQLSPKLVDCRLAVIGRGGFGSEFLFLIECLFDLSNKVDGVLYQSLNSLGVVEEPCIIDREVALLVSDKGFSPVFKKAFHDFICAVYCSPVQRGKRCLRIRDVSIGSTL